MSERKNNRRTKEIFREWLEKLQQESWQLELLISGLALFGIWESRALLDNFGDYLELNASGSLRVFLNGFFVFLKVSWIVFFINLLVHIIIRGLWIGAIGLRYVSGDIDYAELAYADKFDKFLRKNVGDFDDYIERLERLSSIIFSFTFLLLFFFLSILSISVFLIFIFELGDNFSTIETDNPGEVPWVVSVFLIIIFLSLIVFIDFISFGSLKRIESPIFSVVYYWIYRFIGVLTLSFLFRPLLYNFIDDKYTKRLVIIAIPYILFVSLITPSLGFDTYNYHPSFSGDLDKEFEISARSFKYIYYDDLREQYAKREYDNGRRPIIDWVSLSSYEYNNQSLAKIFFRSSTTEQKIIERKYPHLVPFTEKGFHSIFNSNKLDNIYIDSLNTEEVKIKQLMRKVVRGELNKITDEEKRVFGEEIEYYQKLDSKYLESLTEEIHDEFDIKRDEYYERYLDDILDAKKSLITIKVDSTEITDQLDCSFFNHPNMGERGILCYFPISSYENGKHEIVVNIEQAMRKGEGSTYINKKFPFMINRN